MVTGVLRKPYQMLGSGGGVPKVGTADLDPEFAGRIDWKESLGNGLICKPDKQ